MFLRILAITLILVCASVAWLILGATIDHRTFQYDGKLRSGVASIWGTPQEQAPPSAYYDRIDQRTVETETDGHKTTRTEKTLTSVALALEGSRVKANFWEEISAGTPSRTL